jgi:hypothetical protein
MDGKGTDLETSTQHEVRMHSLDFEFATPINFQDSVQQCKLERPRL